MDKTSSPHNKTRLALEYTDADTDWPRGYKTVFMLNSAEHEI